MFNTITDLHIASDSFTIKLEYSDGECVKVTFKPMSYVQNHTLKNTVTW
jgi:hypothetical protein